MIDQSRSSRPLIDAETAAELAYSDPQRAVERAEAALAAAAGDVEVTVTAQRALGMAAAAGGDLARATRLLQRAAEVAEHADLSLRAGQARGSLAYVRLLTTGAPAALRELDRADAWLADGASAARLQMQRGLVLSEIRRFDEAVVSLDRALATLAGAGGDDLLEADIRTNRAIVDLGRRDWTGAHAQLDRAEALYARGGHEGRTAMVWHNRGVVDSRRGDLPASLAAYAEAAERYRRAGLYRGLLAVDRAEALLGARLVAEARAVATEAVHEFERRHNAVDLVQARLLLAEAALLDGDHRVAVAEASRARRAAERQERPRWAALAGYLRLQSGWRAGTATPGTAAELVGELAAAGWAVPAAEAQLIVARLAIRRGRPELAAAHLSALSARRRRGTVEERVRAWHAEALRRRAAGDRPGAARAVRTGLDLLDEFRAGLGATELRAHASAHSLELARFGVELALESGRPTAVLAAADRGRAAALRFRPARPPDDAALAADLAELRRVATALRDGDEPPAPLLARQRALELAVRDRARIAPGGLGAAERPTAARDLRAALGAATLVEYVEHDGDLHAVVVRAAGVTVRPAGKVAAAGATVESLRTSLGWLAHGVGSERSRAALLATVEHGARALEADLLPPLPDGTPLVVVATGPLHALPWGALPSLAGRPVSVAPSAAHWLRARRADREGERVVLAHGPDLAFAPAEIATLHRTYPHARVLAGPAAEVAPLLAALDGADTVHLAAHGTFRADNPMFSELRFADGPLTVYDLERLAVAPRRVVLASCDSGRAGVTSGDDLIGLAAALLALGSTSLVAAVIPVPDEASQALMVRLHAHLAAGHGSADALARARADTAADGPGALAAAAGFVCFGAG